MCAANRRRGCAEAGFSEKKERRGQFFAASGAFLLVVFPISCYDIHNLKRKKERKGVFAIALTNASLPAKRRILKVCVKLFLEQGYPAQAAEIMLHVKEEEK